MINKILLAIAIMLGLAAPAQAFEISTKVGSSVSNTLSFKNYTATGHVVTVTDSQRDIFDVTGGIVTVGEVVKHSVVDVAVNQGGSGVGAGGSATVYANMAHGNIEVGASYSIGSDSMNMVSWDNSVVHETGVAVTDVDLFAFPFHVGSSTETVYTNTWVSLANVDYTQSSGSWASSSVYIK